MDVRVQGAACASPVGATHGLFLTAYLHREARMSQVKKACASFPSIVHAVTEEAAKGRTEFSERKKPGPATPFALRGIVGIGTQRWLDWYPHNAPRNMLKYETLEAPNGVSLPATGGDISVHLWSDRFDLCNAIARRFVDEIGRDNCWKIDDFHMFKHTEDNRDLTGFIDGTKNRGEEEKRAQLCIIGAEDANHKGGAFMYNSIWHHNLPKFNAMPIPEQENVIGRTKVNGKKLREVERPKPKDSHIARNEVKVEEGKFHHQSEREYEIVRHSMPFATVEKQGLVFLGYTNALHRINALLGSMLGISNAGPQDRLLAFSKAVAGNFYYVPHENILQSMAN